jgi:hypothetical protein
VLLVQQRNQKVLSLLSHHPFSQSTIGMEPALVIKAVWAMARPLH